jgi:flagellar biosynthesis anti-sigma factor FlgM
MAAGRRAVEQAPEVRSERVEELKRRIASGEYDVPAEVLARALLKEDRG